MPQTIAVIRHGKVAELITRRLGQEVKRDHDPGTDSTFRLVDVSARPDIKVGTLFPFKLESQAIADGDLTEPGILPKGA
jgi:hypothetical protein